jgi:hypothetical protein
MAGRKVNIPEKITRVFTDTDEDAPETAGRMQEKLRIPPSCWLHLM